MRVRAQEGQKCPMEGNPRVYITDDCDGVEVEPTAYYRRLLEESGDGSLIEIKMSDDAVVTQQQDEEEA